MAWGQRKRLAPAAVLFHPVPRCPVMAITRSLMPRRLVVGRPESGSASEAGAASVEYAILAAAIGAVVVVGANLVGIKTGQGLQALLDNMP